MKPSEIAENQSPSTVYRRIFATLIDLITMAGIVLLFHYLLDNELFNRFMSVIFLVSLFHPALLEYALGWSVGKLVMGLRVVAEEKSRFRFLNYMISHVVRILEIYLFQIVGFIGQQLAVESSDANVGGYDTLGIYTDGFMLIAQYSLGAGLIVLIFSPLIKRLMGNVH